MASLVRPIAAMSSPATGGSGQLPKPATTRPTSKSSSWSLCSAVSTTRAAICTLPATLAVGALCRRRLARLQTQDGGARVFIPVEVVVELFGADQRAPGPAAHREVAVAIEPPAGVLRRQGRDRGPIRSYYERREPAAFDDQ